MSKKKYEFRKGQKVIRVNGRGGSGMLTGFIGTVVKQDCPGIVELKEWPGGHEPYRLVRIDNLPIDMDSKMVHDIIDTFFEADKKPIVLGAIELIKDGIAVGRQIERERSRKKTKGT
jgi:hypothetical protein